VSDFVSTWETIPSRESIESRELDEEKEIAVSVREGLVQRSEWRGVVEQVQEGLPDVKTWIGVGEVGSSVVEAKVDGRVVCGSARRRDAVLCLPLRHEPDPLSPAGLVHLLCDVTGVRDLSVEHSSGVGVSSSDSSVRVERCDGGKEKSVERFDDVSRRRFDE
jgi:hypothetical protein